MPLLVRSLSLLAAFLMLLPASLDAQAKRAPDVRYEPSSPEIVSAMLKLADVKAGDLVYDLGCGDGRIVIAAARDFGARGVGIDIDPERIREARENARKAGVNGRVEFRNEDLFEADIRKATVVMLYLYPWVNLKLRPKLLRELKPGTRIVSHSHDMGDWKPEKEIEAGGSTLYFWTIPASSAAAR
ncbi:MAG TPA: methyltransferase domain-containing protein [Bryobacteraceae bacterium]|nr:methyltransferase domain-containing protein [Bryobacteraceae bacterium]